MLQVVELVRTVDSNWVEVRGGTLYLYSYFYLYLYLYLYLNCNWVDVKEETVYVYLHSVFCIWIRIAIG